MQATPLRPHTVPYISSFKIDFLSRCLNETYSLLMRLFLYNKDGQALKLETSL